MRLILLLAVGAVLAGCAPTLHAVNDTGGIIEHSYAMNRAQVLKQADDYCAKAGKRARIANQNDLFETLTFECVQR